MQLTPITEGEGTDRNEYNNADHYSRGVSIRQPTLKKLPLA